MEIEGLKKKNIMMMMKIVKLNMSEFPPGELRARRKSWGIFIAMGL
jgi:hypothetical protein